MSKFLRDQYIRNVNVNESFVENINDTIKDIVNIHNISLPKDEESIKIGLVQSYIIRFDNKGFLLYDYETLVKYFKEAIKIERLVFIIDSFESRSSNRQFGKCIDLRLDYNDQSNSSLTVQADHKEWVDAAFSNLFETINKYSNKNYLIRNKWINFIVQIVGVFIGFVLSLWAALKISPSLSIEYSFIVTFILAFILFSNIWTYANPLILRLLNHYYPNIKFRDTKGLHWLIKAVISSTFVALLLYLINLLYGYLGELFKTILK
ncbi:MAG: hypothetical protein NTZ27_00780 [Ignavibacteriales bacterium]|nr:hypothetical protein [Ignavibacteriales bacterium]